MAYAPIARQFIGFAAVGAIGTGAHFLTLIFLVQVGRVDPVIASVFGSLVGAGVNYVLSYHWVFRSSKPHQLALLQFLTVAGIGFALNAAIMAVLVKGFALYYLLSQVSATGAVLGWNFLANRFWTFRHDA
jgi:putative flippase GtrA